MSRTGPRSLGTGTGAGHHVRENPARVDETVGTVHFDDPRRVDAVVRRAGEAQQVWARVPVAERAARLMAGTARVRAAVDDLARSVARETGKVLADARGEAEFSATVIDWYAQRAEALVADRELDDELGRLRIRHRPYGVVGAVTPWNAPLVLAALKLGPALVAGNAVVLKPSPMAPFALSGFVEALVAELPDGLVQVVHGEAETAIALVSHPGVHRVAFTGGERAGRALAALAGRCLTPSVMELGGNDPAVVLPDADLDDAAYERLVMAAFATSGQVCMAVKRLYVPQGRAAEALEGLAAAADRVLRVGDPQTPGVTMGPVVSEAARTRLAGLLEGARAVGGQVHGIGSVVGDLSRGWFVRPCLVTGLGESADLVATEQFGPLLPVQTYTDVDHAVALANAGDLGLGASVWSRDEDRAFEVAARLDAGFTFVNTHNRTGMSLRAPFGGVKRSGWGREYGDQGLGEYVQECVTHLPGGFRGGAAQLAATAYPRG